MKSSLEIGLVETDDKHVYRLVVNGAEITEAYAFGEDKGLVSATVHDEKTWNYLTSFRVKDLAKHFLRLSTRFDVEWGDWDKLDLWFSDYGGKRKRYVQIALQPDYEHWARPYSLAEYAEAFEKAVKTTALPGVRYFENDELISNGFGIRCRMGAATQLVSDVTDRCSATLERISETAEELLVTNARKNAVTSFFTFPAPVRTACEQYLLYFVQFLEDLGIVAEAEIKEDARRILFSVTPTDGPNALQKVRAALDLYLRLPGAPDFSAEASQYPDMAVQQLHANVLHLKSQMMLANASMHAQEATIEALRLSNYQYRQLISAEKTPKDQTEALIGDTVHVTSVRGKGLDIDLPLILSDLYWEKWT